LITIYRVNRKTERSLKFAKLRMLKRSQRRRSLWWRSLYSNLYKDSAREVVVDLDYGVISAGSRGHSTLLK